jgi:hypothetical protein
MHKKIVLRNFKTVSGIHRMVDGGYKGGINSLNIDVCKKWKLNVLRR